MKALWNASNGVKYIIEGDTVEEIQETIASMRKALNIETPSAMVMDCAPELAPKNSIKMEELPEEVQEELKDAIEAREICNKEMLN